MAVSWSRDAVIYQVYVRSFADADGDGVGDLLGVASRLDYIADLGVDAIWLTPFYPSPMADGGYDVADYRDVDPRFGTLADFDKLLVEAHARGLRVHHRHRAQPLPRTGTAWFQAALAAGPGSPERGLFHFRQSGGDAAAEQLAVHLPRPGLDPPARRRLVPAPVRPGAARPQLGPPGRAGGVRRHPAVLARPRRRRHPHRRGPRHGQGARAAGRGRPPARCMLVGDETPFFDQDGVHEIYRAWRSILDSYTPERIAVAEAWLPDAAPDGPLRAPGRAAPGVQLRVPRRAWSGPELPPRHRRVAGRHAAGRRADHLGDVQPRRGPARLAAGRRASAAPPAGPGRPAAPSGPGRPGGRAAPGPRGHPADAGAARLGLPVPGRGAGAARGVRPARRSRARTRSSPVRRGAELGRDGCRVPLPWSGSEAPYGFGPAGSTPWLPQPAAWAGLSVAAQRATRRRRCRSTAPRCGCAGSTWGRSPAWCGTARPARTCSSSTVPATCAVRPCGAPSTRAPRTYPLWTLSPLVASGPMGPGGELPPDTAAWWFV